MTTIGTVAVKVAWGDFSDEEEDSYLPGIPRGSSPSVVDDLKGVDRRKPNTVLFEATVHGNSRKPRTSNTKVSSHSTSRVNSKKCGFVRESRKECFERRYQMILTYLDKNPFSILTGIHAHLLKQEGGHRFPPTVPSVHASLFHLKTTGAIKSVIEPGRVRWAREGANGPEDTSL